MNNETSKFEPTEIAYHVPGTGWKTKTVRTEAALEKLLAKLEDLGVTETQSRAAL